SNQRGGGREDTCSIGRGMIQASSGIRGAGGGGELSSGACCVCVTCQPTTASRRRGPISAWPSKVHQPSHHLRRCPQQLPSVFLNSRSRRLSSLRCRIISISNEGAMIHWWPIHRRSRHALFMTRAWGLRQAYLSSKPYHKTRQ